MSSPKRIGKHILRLAQQKDKNCSNNKNDVDDDEKSMQFSTKCTAPICFQKKKSKCKITKQQPRIAQVAKRKKIDAHTDT